MDKESVYGGGTSPNGEGERERERKRERNLCPQLSLSTFALLTRVGQVRYASTYVHIHNLCIPLVNMLVNHQRPSALITRATTSSILAWPKPSTYCGKKERKRKKERKKHFLVKMGGEVSFNEYQTSAWRKISSTSARVMRSPIVVRTWRNKMVYVCKREMSIYKCLPDRPSSLLRPTMKSESLAINREYSRSPIREKAMSRW